MSTTHHTQSTANISISTTSRLARLLAGAVLALVTVLTLAPAQAQAQAASSATVSPDPVPEGTSFTVSGSGFQPGENVSVDWFGSIVAAGTADANGDFSVTASTPPGAPIGPHVLYVNGDMGSTVTLNPSLAPAPAASPTPTPAPSPSPAPAPAPAPLDTVGDDGPTADDAEKTDDADEQALGVDTVSDSDSGPDLSPVGLVLLVVALGGLFVLYLLYRRERRDLD